MRKLLTKHVLVLLTIFSGQVQAGENTMLIDDFSDPEMRSPLGTQWRAVSDQVMGGISQGNIERDSIDGRECLRLQGRVRLENNGGFLQAALNLANDGRTFDASAFSGLRLLVRGNGQRYSVHLRTPDIRRPWQSYRAEFVAQPTWQVIDLPFEAFTPYRLDVPLNRGRLRRLGIVAIGRDFEADLAIANLAFYR